MSVSGGEWLLLPQGTFMITVAIAVCVAVDALDRPLFVSSYRAIYLNTSPTSKTSSK